VCATGYGIRRSKDLRARFRKFLNLTNERKNMSTKTLRKRIALVAVATLGAGVLSVAPAFATDAASLVTAIAPSGTAANGVCNASATSGTTMLVGGSLTVTTTGVASDGTYANDTFVASGPLAFTAASAGTVTSSSLVTANDGAISTSTVTVRATALGSGTIAYKAQGVSVLQTLNVTVVDACSSGVSAANTYIQVSDLSSAVYSAADIAAGTGTTSWNSTTALDNSVDYPSSTFVNGGTAYIAVAPRTVYKGDVTSGYLTLTATNGALVNNIAGGATAAVSHTYGNTFTVTQPTFGAPLTTTVTVSYNGTVLGTKNITITGDVASMTTSYVYSGTSGNTATQSKTADTGRISYKLYDSAKNWLTNSSTLYPVSLYKSSNPAVINTATQDSSHYSNPAGLSSGRFYHNCIGAATSGSSTLTFLVTSKAGTSITSNVDVTCSADTANYTASFDKATYNVGDIATLTIKGSQ
jgi:trimeric autotransporter adhesin